MSKPCRYIDQWGHFLRSHDLNCKDNSCEGCQPCMVDEHGNRVRHCTVRQGLGKYRPECGNHLAPGTPQTCPGCVGKVRANITYISRNAQLLTAAAIEAGGVETEAAMLAGPAADPFVWSKRRAWQFHNGGVDLLDEEDPHHPLSVLGRWEQMFRDHYQQPPTHGANLHAARANAPRWTNIITAAGYLFDKLTLAAQDEDIDWEQFANEIYVCRTHIEDVLNTTVRAETGAPCPSCADAPPLRKRYAHWCDRESCTKEHDTSGATDVWRCPRCRAQWSEGVYRKWVADDFLQNADQLTVNDIHMIYGIPTSTVRRWASTTTKNGDVVPPKIKPVGRSTDGRRTYSVEAVLKLRDEHTQKETA